ncbi:MAG: hypothetical protein V8R11_08145 [Alphaproteobacteria bacterium]
MNNDDSLDAFLTADMPAEEKKNNKDTSLEDEFAKLLNDFINQDKPAAKPDNKKTEDSLDSFLESSGSGLDSFLTSPVVPSENTPAAQPQQTSFNAELWKMPHSRQRWIICLVSKFSLYLPLPKPRRKIFRPTILPQTG